MTKRNIAAIILLSIITCGIYGIYWNIVVWNEMNDYLCKKNTSGGVCFLLSLVTCGIYGIYWNYKLSQLADEVTGEKNYILGFILLWFIPFVGQAIIQDSLNKVE